MRFIKNLFLVISLIFFASNSNILSQNYFDYCSDSIEIGNLKNTKVKLFASYLGLLSPDPYQKMYLVKDTIIKNKLISTKEKYKDGFGIVLPTDVVNQLFTIEHIIEKNTVPNAAKRGDDNIYIIARNNDYFMVECKDICAENEYNLSELIFHRKCNRTELPRSCSFINADTTYKRVEETAMLFACGLEERGIDTVIVSVSKSLFIPLSDETIIDIGVMWVDNGRFFIRCFKDIGIKKQIKETPSLEHNWGNVLDRIQTVQINQPLKYDDIESIFELKGKLGSKAIDLKVKRDESKGKEGLFQILREVVNQ